MTTTTREFALPDLGEGLTEAEIVRWLVSEGDSVHVDQPVVEVETAKAVVEVPCPYAGVVVRLWGRAGDSLDVGQPLVSVRERRAAEDSGNVLVGYGTSPAAARRRRIRPRSSGQPPAAPAAPAAFVAMPRPGGGPAGPVPVISPLVRRLARERGLDLRTIRGSGPGGLVRRQDIEAFGAPPAAAAEAVRLPLRGVRGLTADKLARSRREIPDATTWVDTDATALLDVKRQLAAPDAQRISLLALLARVCLAALARYPELNATVDTDRREIVRLPSVHLGFAAQTGRGLVVPVVRDADRRTLPELAAEISRLTAGAREGTLTPAELSGGTFTLNNYGVFGVDGSTPIINHPEAAMLGVGRILPRPWVVDGEPTIRQLCQLSLTFDHRVCDGGVAGGFLRHVADLVERPVSLLRLL
ncbi:MULTISPECIES: dihydrolipoamide acetyltransferase family protein [unclassified Streptomyces]|uniref:dihydrolipoamide acetyltransferase family protein n=1 Tax=unclassified Streptomyces TaxID=2593676 RepID=UPI000DAE71CB|nr:MULTISPECIES: dihydrolipoamide acetyltransferase family protein [unclassified Streptomyces]PZT77625.1 2-oxo acid dehydrogenase subunit E2 [Streptomyces sp. AC1-42W]PZT78421.1 2-oxo acid dehydrogenase subunit E2 [Streptomyces sp. AC1-42T]